MNRLLFSIFVLPGVALAACAQTGEAFKPGKLPAAEVAQLQPGLTLRFHAKAGDAKALDARRVRLAALHVPKGSPPTPFLAPGPFHASLTGYVKNPLKADYRFRLSGVGTMSLRINGKEILAKPGDVAEVELAKNYNRIEIVYTSPKDANATVRLDWAGEKFGFEPVPPDVLYSRKNDADLVAQFQLREGRELYARQHCNMCHGTKVNVETVAMPELAVRWHDRAPRLDAVGDRFNADWLTAWILDPRALRPDATMPKLLAGPDAEKKAADIAAYLLSLRGKELAPITRSTTAEKGEIIFKRLGCNTCHRLDAPGMKDDLDRVSLHHVSAKFAPNALAHFLKDPPYRYGWTRMPDFKLSDAEAGQLESYLREGAKGKFVPLPKGDAMRGEKLFGEARCNYCHTKAGPKYMELNGIITKLSVPIKKLNKGCLADNDRGNAPDIGLTVSDRSALTSFMKTDGMSLTRETPAEFSIRQVQALRCDSCHRRDGNITRWHTVLEDDLKVPENLPSLTWVGEKLQPAWTKTLLLGKTDHSARPWIKARMPAFPARADMLAVGLSHEHGFGIDEDDRPKPDPKLAAIGEKLIPQQGGFNCNNCHGIGNQKAIQPFEAPGINLTDAAVRLRYNYYQRWMLTPDRIDVTMRMPVFAVDGKTTQIREPFNGDARQQFDALWHYIQTLPPKSGDR